MMRKLVALGLASIALVVFSSQQRVLAQGQMPLMGQAQGEVTPGSFPGELVISGSGLGTLTGPFTLHAEHVYISPVEFVGSMTLIAANGDVLAASYEGQSVFIPGPNGSLVAVTDTIQATVDGSQSTGVYAGSIGSFTVRSATELAAGAPFVFNAMFAGSIHKR